MCVLMYAFAHVCGGWRLISCVLLHLSVLRQGLLLNLELDDLLDLASQLAWGMLCLLYLNAGVAEGLPCPSVFMWVLRIWTTVFMIAQQTHYPRSLLPALTLRSFNHHCETQHPWNLQGQTVRTTWLCWSCFWYWGWIMWLNLCLGSSCIPQSSKRPFLRR